MDIFPRLRDTLTRGFFPAVAGHTYAWIGEEIAHAKTAKDAKPRRGPRLRSGQVGVDAGLVRGSPTL